MVSYLGIKIIKKIKKINWIVGPFSITPNPTSKVNFLYHTLILSFTVSKSLFYQWGITPHLFWSIHSFINRHWQDVLSSQMTLHLTTVRVKFHLKVTTNVILCENVPSLQNENSSYASGTCCLKIYSFQIPASNSWLNDWAKLWNLRKHIKVLAKVLVVGISDHFIIDYWGHFNEVQNDTRWLSIILRCPWITALWLAIFVCAKNYVPPCAWVGGGHLDLLWFPVTQIFYVHLTSQ